MADCYIFWDDSVEDKKIYTQCENCHQDNGKGVRWKLYSGTVIICCLCEAKINEQD